MFTTDNKSQSLDEYGGEEKTMNKKIMNIDVFFFM